MIKENAIYYTNDFFYHFRYFGIDDNHWFLKIDDDDSSRFVKSTIPKIEYQQHHLLLIKENVFSLEEAQKIIMTNKDIAFIFQ